MDYFFTLLFPMLQGAKTVVLLFLIVILLSIPLGFLLTLIVASNNKLLSKLGEVYIYIMRGTPLLLQLLLICFGLPMVPVIGEYLVFDRFVAACIGFILNYTAYFAEIFRGGLLSIDRGQYEAAYVLGLNKKHTYRKIILPQMVRISIPTITNEAVTLVKDTALLYAVAVPELLHFAQTAVNRDSSIMPYLMAGMIYLLMTIFLTLLFKWVERRLNVSYR